ncbi:hypothetical protein F5887DRAFT_1081714 [Amanita rubescens]|nr:hypothetical protein F5887DRAFT_1081714 [Amanita rubescens]
MASKATQQPQGASTVVPPTPHEVLEAQLLLAWAKKGKPRKKPLKASHTVSTDDGNASDKENEPGNNDEGGCHSVCHYSLFIIHVCFIELWHSWHDPAFHHYSDTLLTIIEDSICCRKAFGFKGGDDHSVTSSGLSLIQTCRLIALQLFPTHPETNMEKLAHAVKNRVSNSSSLDLQAVENVAEPMSASCHSPDWDDFGDDEDSVKSSPSPENSQAPPAVLAPLHPPTPSASEPQKIIPQKRKLSAFDHLKDVSEQNQKTHISVAQIKAQT